MEQSTTVTLPLCLLYQWCMKIKYFASIFHLRLYFSHFSNQLQGIKSTSNIEKYSPRTAAHSGQTPYFLTFSIFPSCFNISSKIWCTKILTSMWQRYMSNAWKLITSKNKFRLQNFKKTLSNKFYTYIRTFICIMTGMDICQTSPLKKPLRIELYILELRTELNSWIRKLKTICKKSNFRILTTLSFKLLLFSLGLHIFYILFPSCYGVSELQWNERNLP